jgi:thymidylate synthase (FAD)
VTTESLDVPDAASSEVLNVPMPPPEPSKTFIVQPDTRFVLPPLVLDSTMHVDLVQAQGDDTGIANAARVSTTGSMGPRETSDEDIAGLIDYLMKHRHGSPFEHNTFTFFVEAPIFVFREFHRHRVGWSYNEQSGRYRELQPHFWIPPINRRIKQTGKAAHYRLVPGSVRQIEVATEAMVYGYKHAWEAYQAMLREGVAREVARSVLPVGIYSSMYATCNARSLMHFLSLRTDDNRAINASKPMAEIEQVAREIERLFQGRMPLTHAAFNKWGRVAP